MRKISVLLTLPFLFLITLPATAQSFDKQGVSFTVPDGWKITEEEDLNGKGYYLSCEKEGKNASGIVTIRWINDTVSTSNMVDQYINGLRQNFAEKNAKRMLFGTPEPAKVSNFNGVSADFSFSLMDIQHRGQIGSFHASGKTFTILMQEATEDIAENKPGFAAIMSSFSCE